MSSLWNGSAMNPNRAWQDLGRKRAPINHHGRESGWPDGVRGAVLLPRQVASSLLSKLQGQIEMNQDV